MNQIPHETILVPVDFSKVVDYSTDHALAIAGLFNHKICLLHIMDEKSFSKTQEKEEVEKKLITLVHECKEKSGLEVDYMVRAGSIFSEISKVAEEIKAEFVIMGIHAKKSIKNIFGTDAYKVILSSPAPVLVVKDRHHHKGYPDIVLPLDFTHETTSKIKIAIKFARYFDATIRIIGVLDTGSSVYKLHKEALIKKATSKLDQAGVKYTSELFINPGVSLHQAITDYAHKIDAELIMIVAEKGSMFSELFFPNTAEQIIVMSDIPVLTLIPGQWGVEEDDGPSVVSHFLDPFGVLRNQSDEDSFLKKLD